MNEEIIYENNNLFIKKIELGILLNNVYLIESNGESAIVDPSCKANEILQFAKGYDINKILLTHYHFDHVGAANDLKNFTNAIVYASEIDSEYIENSNSVPVFHRKVDSCKVDIKVKENDEIKIGNSNWRVIETPGHTKGSICFYYDDNEQPILLAGDTLFKCSCGRTDFPDSVPQLMENSLRKLSKLPDNTLVLPGHQSMTTIKNEKSYMLNFD